MKSMKRGAAVLLSGSLVLAALCLWLYVPGLQSRVAQWCAAIAGYFTEMIDTEAVDGITGGTGSDAEMPDGGGTGTLIDSDELDTLEDSGITGEDYTVDMSGCPYYSFLTEAGQSVYRQVCANIEALETTFVPAAEISVSEAMDVMEAVFGDHPEYFWIETSYGYWYTSEEICVQLVLYFNSTSEDLESARQQFDAVVDEIVSGAESLDSDYEKEKYVHDAILEIAEYDESVSSSLSQSAYSALVMGRTVCAGYARAFQYIMKELGIETYYVTGYASANHAWNIVALSDGYYNVDLTWDDSVTVAYTYFNIPDSVFSQTHTRTGLSTQLPTCTATEYYNPEISQDAGQVPERFRPEENSEGDSSGGTQEPQTGETSQPGTDEEETAQPSQPGTDEEETAQPSQLDTDEGDVSQPSQPGTDEGDVSQPSQPDTNEGEPSQSGTDEGEASQPSWSDGDLSPKDDVRGSGFEAFPAGR
ncbi:MAG: hypothetical protein LUC90_01045 [Lachnospiraceae bacterium]|nr:hypothetical protein [Lachnospiraceae bacterium]